MVVERNGRIFRGGNLIPGFQQGFQAAFCGGDAGEKTDDTADCHDPNAEAEPILEPEASVQKQAQGKKHGKTELTDPQDHGKKFHRTSAV